MTEQATGGDRPPQVGMQATLRNRRGRIAAVDPYDAPPEGRLHLVQIEYTDRDGVMEDTVIWEREPAAKVLEPHALPQVGTEPAMIADEFDALVRATRWTALTPFLKPDGSGERSELPIAAPFFGAVQVDDFQLVPLLKALEMPRVSLLLADDVGLGKTIEAGLILTELLIRRRIRRVLIMCPASIRRQWREEMDSKFALDFDIVDRAETHALQRRLGLDVNPWRTYQRIITSYHYLRQPDVLEQFLSTCRGHKSEGGQRAYLPWDLLIVDEAHNLTPSAFGDDSDLAKMLRAISPWFEHKLFLTATPHNGHTRSFSGLLEQLDPVRFAQTSEFSAEEKSRVEEVVVRRLKREINELDDQASRPRRFADRDLEPLALQFSPQETALSAAVEEFRKAVKELIRSGERSQELAGNFAIEVLSKRLLSSPSTFAESWFRIELGLTEDEEADASEVKAAQKASEEDIDDDREKEGRVHHAARTIGAWLQPLAGKLQSEIGAINEALVALGFSPSSGDELMPDQDTRFDAVVELIEHLLRSDGGWRDDERLILFTEYKTTLDYLERRLRTQFSDKGEAIRVLFGGMDEHEREDIKSAFNDSFDAVRVLVATDAASEGLNLQETARYILHYEVPWNPSRLEQRNGRLDRHGQARDVVVHHFTSEDNADMRFIARVVDKVHNIREDLGSTGEIFDAAFQRRFVDQEDVDHVIDSLDLDIRTQKGAAAVPRPKTESTGGDELERLTELGHEIDLSPETLLGTLDVAMGIHAGRPRLKGPDARGRMKLVQPLPPRWQALIDDSLRLEARGTTHGALPGLIFDPRLFITEQGGRPVFRPQKDTVLLHLGHPIFRQALADFARARFPGGGDAFISRWVVRRGGVPEGAEALILLSVEELAVNDLREPFHHWIRTLRLPVNQGELGEPLPHLQAVDLSGEEFPPGHRAAAEEQATELWIELEKAVRGRVRRHAESLTQQINSRLEHAKDEALSRETERFKLRLGEVERAMRETSIKKVEKERDKLIDKMKQLKLLELERREQQVQLRDLEAELERRRGHYQELLNRLQNDQERVLEFMLPSRYTIRDKALVYPVAVEIRLPGGSQ